MRGRIHPEEAVYAALKLSQSGLSDYEVARRLGVARATVQNWRSAGPPSRRPAPPLLRPLDEPAYSYLLGLHLGDGWIGWHGRTYGLHISLDSRYRRIIRGCERAIESCVGSQAHSRDRNGRGVCVVYCYRRDWPHLIPQHGPGKKHLRKIELVPWQLAITHQCAREFIRGLIHSDGSRCINRFAVKLPSGRVGLYEYPRYFFTNYSADIRQIFCHHCDLLGIRWTQSNPRNISISHRDSVAILDSFVGPKS